MFFNFLIAKVKPAGLIVTFGNVYSMAIWIKQNFGKILNKSLGKIRVSSLSMT